MNQGRSQGKAAGQRQGAKGGKGAKAPLSPRGAGARAGGRSARPPIGPRAVAAPEHVAGGAGMREAVATTVAGLGYALVDLERGQRGLLRVTIDRISGRAYAQPGDAVTVDDCEQVTRQLQYVLEVEGVDYARLEVSSPGLDRPLKTESDYERFAGEEARVVLKVPFEGRKAWQGRLERAPQGGWQLVFTAGKVEQAFGFGFDEVREARLVPVVDFKGRRSAGKDAGRDEGGARPPSAPASKDGADDKAQTKGE